MENKQKEQLKKILIFTGLGLLFALSMWFIFKPSGKDKTAAEQGLNDSIPQATTEQLTGNKLKAYELGDKMQQEEQAREELGRLSDYFAENTEPSDAERTQAAATTAKIENSMQRYEENTRLLNSFYAPDPHEQEREALRQEIDNLKKELSEQSYKEEDEERKQLALMEKVTKWLRNICRRLRQVERHQTFSRPLRSVRQRRISPEQRPSLPLPPQWRSWQSVSRWFPPSNSR